MQDGKLKHYKDNISKLSKRLINSKDKKEVISNIASLEILLGIAKINLDIKNEVKEDVDSRIEKLFFQANEKGDR